MALEFAHGAIQWLAADAAGATYSVSGLSSQPKAIRFYWQGMASATDAVSQATHGRRGVGFATSTSNRRAVGTYSQDASTAAACAAVPVDLAVAVLLNNAGGTAGLLDINAINSDGFQLIIDTQATANITLFWEAWGGTDITVAAAGHFFEPAATGNQDYTVSGFVAAATDQVVMFGGCWGGVINVANEIDSCMTVGFASSGSAADNVHITGNSDEASATMDTDGYCKTGECLSFITNGGGNPDARAQLTQFGTDNFRLNWIARASTTRCGIYLAIKGGSWKAGNYTIDGSTLNATATVSGLAFAPKGLSLIARLSVESTAGTSVAEDRMGLGSGSSTTSRRSMGMWDENGTGNAELNHTIQYDQVLSFPDNAGALLAAFDINAMNSDGFQIIVDDPGGVAGAWHGYLTFGDAAAGGQPIVVAQTSETNVAQAIAVIVGALIIGLGQASEADAAQIITPTQGTTISIAQVAEIDAAQIIGVSVGAVTIAVGQASENDTAQIIVPALGVVTVTVGQATEADVAQVIGVQVGVVTISVVQTSEADAAQSITVVTGTGVVAVNQAAETDSAQAIAAVAGAITISVAQVSETDSAQAVAPVLGALTVAVGQVIEVDSAQTISVVGGAVSANHVRRQIREAFAARTTGLTTTGARVFQSRTRRLAAADIPCLRIYVENETIISEDVLGAPYMQHRIINVRCEALAKQSADLVDKLKLICKEVQVAIAANDRLGVIAKLPGTLTGIEINQDGSSDLPAGLAAMDWQFVVLTWSDAPDVVL